MNFSKMIQKRPKDTKGTLKRLCKTLAPFKVIIFIVAFLSLLSCLLSLLGPYFCGEAINEVEKGPGAIDFDVVWKWALLMLFSYIISEIVYLAINLLMVLVSKKTGYALRKECFDKLHRLPVSVFDTNRAGDILSRVSYDVDVVATSIQADISQILTTIITVLGSFFMMVKISLPLSIVTMVTLPITILYTIRIKGITRPLYSKRSEKYGEMNGFVEEMFSGEKTIQAYSYEGKVAKQYRDINRDASNAYYEADVRGVTIGPTMGMMNNLSLALNGTLGSILYMFSYATLGQLSSFILYSRKFSGPINELANIMNEIFSALSAAERIYSFLDTEEELPDKTDAKDYGYGDGSIEVRNIHFGYVPSKEILHDVSFYTGKGKTLAIVGETGAGKTTIINLLMRFYRPQAGSILIDGRDSLDMKVSSQRRQFAMVLQDTWLFSGTVFENISYGRDGATMEEVVEAAKKAGIHHFITTLEKEYDTVISEDGGNISKGQKQLLTIARAFLSDSPVLILDEATSNVDTSTEKKVQKAMNDLMKGRTAIVIAHRLSTIENADEIVVMSNGSIVEKGTHSSLLEKKGAYYKLYRSQFS
ncbi:MAG: ABC transporter ATP-binding protein/permease [Spirochaetales bacterium]|nr:ABC transporter ATP-binding protein/permease [Spirochaetales bacterium]